MRKSVAKMLKKMSGGNKLVYKELKRLKRINAIALKQKFVSSEKVKDNA